MQRASLDSERGKLRKAATDGARAAVWIGVFLAVMALVVLGVSWVLGHRWSIGAPELRPHLPALPGKTPEPAPP